MKKYLFFIIFVVLAGCSGKNEVQKFEVPKDYKTWKKPVKNVLNYEIPGHGNSQRIIFANKTAFDPDVVKTATGEERILFKEGSILVKEVYKKNANIATSEPALTIMKKESKNKQALNGWVYSIKRPGKEPVVVTTRMCVGCHESANEGHPYFDKNKKGLFRDYVFVPVK
jgi:hypothetical protein